MPSIALSSSLLKLTVLFISQSLTLLKRKHNFYSLIFINILKKRGLVALNKKINSTVQPSNKNSQLNSGKIKFTPEKLGHLKPTLSYADNLKTAVSTERYTADQGITKGGLLTQPAIGQTELVPQAQQEDDSVKKSTITFYPGGRYISD